MSDEEAAPTDPREAHSASELGKPDRFKTLKRIGRILLFVFGASALVYLVKAAGPSVVWATLTRAGVWLPVIMVLEVLFVGMDVVSLRLMFRERGASVPTLTWLRSAMVAYWIMILLPAGRAGGEVMRAANLAPHVGGPRAAAGAALLNGVTMWGNTLISIPCLIAVSLGSSIFSGLGWLVLGNGVVTAVLGSILLFGARFSKVGGWLGRRIKALGNHGADFDSSLKEMPALPVVPIGAALVGRVFQTVQYGVIVLAVGGSLSVSIALVGQAIHLVGAGMGDIVPNQVGITEGAYSLFASHLGFQHDAAAALAVPLLHRICQFILAGVCLTATSIWAAPAKRAEPVGLAKPQDAV